MKFNRIKFNSEYMFFVFVSLIAALFFLFSGLSVLTCFITALLVYAFLRVCFFFWSMILKLLSTYHGAGKKDAS